MKVILRTLCGCEREMNVSGEPYRITMPLNIPSSVALVPQLMEQVPFGGTREFEWPGHSKDGAMIYEEILRT